MNESSVKYVVLCGILLLSSIQENGINRNQPVEARIDLIHKENHIIAAGSIISNRDMNGLRITLDILGDDRRFVYNLLDIPLNLQKENPVTLKDLNNGYDITFSLEYLYGKYIVIMKIAEGSPSVDMRIEKEFQTTLVFLKTNIPADTPDSVSLPQESKYYSPCCSLRVAQDLNDYFKFNWTEEQTALTSERIEKEIYPKYSNGITDLSSFLNDLNSILELNLDHTQIDELINAIETGIFSERTDALLPPISEEILRQTAEHPSDSSAPFLTGRNVIARIYVNDPDNVWSSDDKNTAWQQVSTAASQLVALAPGSANVSFVHVSFVAPLGGVPDYSAGAPDKDWMEKAVDFLGYSSTEELAQAIKASYNADHVILLFLPHTYGVSYALPYPDGGYGERACVFFYDGCFIVCIKNDEGPYKHEILHLFGACDEHYESQCIDRCGHCMVTYSTYRSLYPNSGNCEYCTSNPVPCVMRSGANDNHAMNDYLCDYTRGQIGWRDFDQDGVLDPFDPCPTQKGSVNNDGCPYSGFADIPSLFSSKSFHVVGDGAKCTDALGTANVSWVYGFKHIATPEGKTDSILTQKEHETNNLIIVGGPAVNPVAQEFGNYFGISYSYQPGVFFAIFWKNQSISLDLQKYPSEDICIVYLGKQAQRNALVIWGYGWQGTYAGSVFMSVPQVWSTYAREHVLLLRWKDSNNNGFIEFSEIHPENIPEVIMYSPSSGTPQLVNPVFGNIPHLFAGYAFHVVGDRAKCTDGLGTANISWAHGFERISRPEGKTDGILTSDEYNNGNLIFFGGPAVNPVAQEFGNYFGISYNYQPGVSFTIFCKNENKSIYLDLGKYPSEDICVVYLGRNSTRTILLIWGYGWQGTYAGSVFMSDIYYWSYYGNNHLLLLRWKDSPPYDGYIQLYEIFIEAVA